MKRDTWFEPWSEHGWLCLTLASSGFDTLGDWLVASVETELLRLGAVPRPDYVSSGFKALLEDQVYRVRMLGFQGLALQLPSLAPWGNDGVLSASDSASLLAWCAAARELAVPLRLSTCDDSLRVFLAPIPLCEADGISFPIVSEPPLPTPVSRVRQAAESGTECLAPRTEPVTEIAELAPESVPANAPGELLTELTVVRDETTPELVPAPAPTATSRRAAMRSLLADEDESDTSDFDPNALATLPVPDLRFAGVASPRSQRATERAPEVPAQEFSEGVSHPAGPVEPPVSPSSRRPEIVPPALRADALSDETAACQERSVSRERNAPDERSVSRERSAPDERSVSRERSVSQDRGAFEERTSHEMQDEDGPFADSWAPFVDARSLAPDANVRQGATSLTPHPIDVDDDSYSHHVEGLQATGGSHGWDEIEHLFETHYLPLQKAVRDGAAPALAGSVLAEWAKDFAESYEQAFDAIRNNRGRKPRLVLDVPSYAFQLSRKHDAEHLKMVLVDGMRADIGPLVADKLRLQMAETASCVATGLLWAALPATTAAQMELIARGSDGLRHFSGELTEAQLMSRGNDLRRLRPVRVGSHRMYKLDIVQYLAKDTERHSSDHLEQYAAEVATSVGRFLRQQEQNTLVYLFGDHGFGGLASAAPERILTPYQAWLIGG